MKVALVITCTVLHVMGLNALIIPDELPSILSVIYSNIPTIKKGTDSRIGWGFRFGDRADFQVMVELGPQTYTQPLANQGGDNANKRNTINNLANTLYAQRQQEKKNQVEKDKVKNNIRKKKLRSTSERSVQTHEESSNTQPGSWLQTWSKTVSSKEENETVPLKAKPGIAIGEIDAKSVIPDDSIPEQIENVKVGKPKKLVNKNSNKKTSDVHRSLISILTEGDQPTKPSPIEKPLDDVSLE